MQNYVLQYFNVKQPTLICIKRKINFKPFGFKIKYIFYNDSVTTKTFYHCLRALELCNLVVRKINHHY